MAVNIKITSDSHLFHENIIKYCGRKFTNLDEMHEHMIKSWNKTVTPDDIVVHLGDYICGGTFDKVKDITDQLNGYKILITGNHDRKGKDWFNRVGFERVFKHRWCLGMYCFSHRPQDALYLAGNGIRYNLHGHSHKLNYGDPYYNFGVDVVGYEPKTVKTNLTVEDFVNGEGSSTLDPFIDYKNGIKRAQGSENE